ncbi:LacI family DNA-binding transcriptional regulator [Pseudonocardia kunmingensis]|uniref:LacI family transcriptional regulator n=1 Tax=Pseudonocardia kunmingensis TaxID=630975 RepID=A0A543DNG6_9PSEU|nr:LacI family DNA-binding transcriptional regulator [Pseudonocardia kunmingensis]TQM10862.1 LacI family transcriptional regulator [Pseudonocardia kunmingensis]
MDVDRGAPSARPRMVDVARVAGVSQKSVSNVLGGYEPVSPELRAKVERAVALLGYVPNSAARTLRTGRTGVIALAVPNLWSPYFAELASHLTDAADERGLTILIDETHGDEDREALIARRLRHHEIDGLVLSPLAMDPASIAAAARSIPMVLLGERELPASVDHVVIDNVAAAREATEHLLELGRRRIATVGAPLDDGTSTGSLRLHGYRAAMAAAGLSDEGMIVRTRHLQRQQGVEAAAQLLAAPRTPDAVFCFNDMLAIGVMHALRLRGVRVPDDVAVVGFDDVAEAAYANPTLTSVHLDRQRIARAALDILVGRLDGSRAQGAGRTVIEHRLVVRESTGGRPDGSRH